MKRKILYVCIGISIVVSVFLGIYIVKCKPVCEQAHVDEINRSIDAVSSEEKAKEIAAACLKLAYDPELQEVPNYDIEVISNDLSYEWIVTFIPKESEKGSIKTVAIRRDYCAINVISGNE